MSRMLKRVLKGILTPDQVRKLYGGFDVIGDIAVIKIPDELLSTKGQIAEAVMQNVKNVRTVLMQTSPVSGPLRLRNLELLLGEDRRTTLYREHGCVFKVDIGTVYFSPRLSTERKRIAELVRPGEVVVNMFAGVGTFSIIIAKKQPEALVYSIDINPSAHELTLENVRLNRVGGRVVPILGDAGEVVKNQLVRSADRVLMPLPEKAAEFVVPATQSLKEEGGVIHYFTHTHGAKRDDAISSARLELEARLQIAHRIRFEKVVREVGPRWFQVVLDVEVTGDRVTNY